MNHLRYKQPRFINITFFITLLLIDKAKMHNILTTLRHSRTCINDDILFKIVR